MLQPTFPDGIRPVTADPALRPTLQDLPRKWAGRIAVVLLLLPLGLLVLGYGILVSSRPQGTALEAGFCILAGLALLALGSWRFWMESGRHARLTELGVELTAAGKLTVIPFAQVQEIWLAARRIQTGGLLGMGVLAVADRIRKDTSLDQRAMTIELRVVGQGATIKLNSQDKGVFAAYQELARRVDPRLLAEARQRLDSGAELRFNKVTLGRDGLAFGSKKPIALAQIAQIAIQDGYLSIKAKDKWFRSHQPVARIPNLAVLLDLLRQELGDTVPMDVPLGMNLASRCNL